MTKINILMAVSGHQSINQIGLQLELPHSLGSRNAIAIQSNTYRWSTSNNSLGTLCQFVEFEIVSAAID